MVMRRLLPLDPEPLSLSSAGCVLADLDLMFFWPWAAMQLFVCLGIFVLNKQQQKNILMCSFSFLNREPCSGKIMKVLIQLFNSSVCPLRFNVGYHKIHRQSRRTQERSSGRGNNSNNS